MDRTRHDRIDAGANIGQYAMLASARVHVHAVGSLLRAATPAYAS
jgi:hypothetical protein